MSRSPRKVLALVLLAVGACGYVLFHGLPFYSHLAYPWGANDEVLAVFRGWSIWTIIWDSMESLPYHLDSADMDDWLELVILGGFPPGMVLSIAAPFMLRVWSGSSVARWCAVVVSAMVIVLGPFAGWLMVTREVDAIRWEIAYYLWWVAGLATFAGLLIAPGKRSSVDA